MKTGGKILAQVMEEVINHVLPGTSEIDLEKLAERLIIEKGAEAAFKKVRGYNFATCISTNEEVVHGIPTERVFKKGDIVGVDCGVFYNGYNTDMAETVKATSEKRKATSKDEIDRFLEIGRKALFEAIKQAKVGNRIGHISKTIQDLVEGNGYSVVRTLVGHGVGRELHEDPEIPGFLDKDIKKTPLIKENQTLAIEVIYNMGDSKVNYKGKDDNWTIVSGDKSLSATFERTVLVTKNSPIILTENSL